MLFSCHVLRWREHYYGTKNTENFWSGKFWYRKANRKKELATFKKTNFLTMPKVEKHAGNHVCLPSLLTLLSKDLIVYYGLGHLVFGAKKTMLAPRQRPKCWIYYCYCAGRPPEMMFKIKQKKKKSCSMVSFGRLSCLWAKKKAHFEFSSTREENIKSRLCDLSRGL